MWDVLLAGCEVVEDEDVRSEVQKDLLPTSHRHPDQIPKVLSRSRRRYGVTGKPIILVDDVQND